MPYANNTSATITGNAYNDFTLGEPVTVKSYDERHKLYTVWNGTLSQTVTEKEIAELVEAVSDKPENQSAKKTVKKDNAATQE
jgi:hypothetical protein